MNNTTRIFPAIVVARTADGYEARVGLELESILKAELFYSQPTISDNKEQQKGENVRQQELHQRRVSLLQAISVWPENVCMELHIVTLPDLQCRPQGRVLVTIALRVGCSCLETVREEVITHYLTLLPILHTCLTEAEFAPVLTEQEFAFRTAPFHPKGAIAVHRREEAISLSVPLQRKVVALMSSPHEGIAEGATVDHRFPWKPSHDEWSCLLETLLNQLDPAHVIVRLQTVSLPSIQRERLADSISRCEASLKSIEAYQLTLNMQVGLLRDSMVRHLASLTDHAFRVGVFLLSPCHLESSVAGVLGQAVTARRLEGEQPGLFQGGFAMSQVPANEAAEDRYFFETDVFSLEEAACAFRLPAPPWSDYTGLPLRRSRTALAFLPDAAGKDDAVNLFFNEHRGLKQSVHSESADRMRHMFIIGQTGTGKSTFMESMILQDIRAGRGLAVIDPHGDMVDSIIGKIPLERGKDVILFDFLDRERPVGFNLLSWASVDERDLVIDELYLTLDRAYDMKQTGGPIFESNFRGMLKLLMGDNPNDEFTPTLLDFVRCYTSKDFRNWLRKRSTDPVVEDFLDELERTGGEARLENLAPYITSKFGRFVHDTTLMRIIGQDKTAFSFDDIINEGSIFLVKLGKGRFGSVVSGMLANQIVARFKHAVMRRGKIRPEDRREFYLYVDECHNLPQENFAELLAEARKYGMGLVLATQYPAQLTSNYGAKNDLLSAIIGNVGTLAIFRLGNEDARLLASALYPNFHHLDILGLPNWQGYARLQSGASPVAPFSFRSVKDTTPHSAANAEKLRRISSLKYGNGASLVDAQIIRHRQTWRNDKNAS